MNKSLNKIYQSFSSAANDGKVHHYRSHDFLSSLYNTYVFEWNTKTSTYHVKIDFELERIFSVFENTIPMMDPKNPLNGGERRFIKHMIKKADEYVVMQKLMS